MESTQKHCNGALGANYAIVLNYVTNSQSVANNTSNVTITGTLKSTDSDYSYYGFTNTGKLMVDGVQKATGSSTAQVDTSGVQLFTYTGDIAHNADGTKTAELQFVFTTTYGNLTDTTLTVSYPLTTIPRASSVTVASTKTISGTGSANNLTYTITSAGDFWHTLTWTIGNTSTTIFSTENPKEVNATTFSGSVSASDILNKMPTSKTATLTFTLKTYSSSACTTQIGTTQTGTCAITISDAVKPTITLSRVEVRTSPISGYMVAGYSSSLLTYSYTKSAGASSLTIYFTANKGVTFETAQSTYTDAGSTKTRRINVVPSSASNYTYTVTVYAIDSRGIRSDDATLTSGTVYGYKNPTVNGTFRRTATNTSTTADPAGLYVYCAFSGTVQSTVNGQNSIQSATCLQDGITSITSGTWISLAESASATFTVTVADKVSSATKTYTVGTAKFPLDLYDTGTGTVGVGFGATAEANKVRSAMPIVLNSDKGIKTYDSGDNEFNLLTYNGTNIWMGARTNGMTHYLGKLYMSSGYNTAESKGNDSVYVAVPNASNTNASMYQVYHEGYFPYAEQLGNLAGFNTAGSWTSGSHDANDAPDGLLWVNCNYVSNCPYTSGNGMILTVAHRLQFFVRHNSAGATYLHVRLYANSQWYPWTKTALTT